MKLQYIGSSAKYEVQNAAISSHVIEVVGKNLISKETGFILIDEDDNEYDYSDFKTLYRTVEGGFQYSNDGSVWVEPTKTVVVSVKWDDENDRQGYRPKQLTVTVLNGDETVDTVVLKPSNNWEKKYNNIPETVEYTVVANDIDNYTKDVDETTIIYTVIAPPAPYVPTELEMIEELIDMVIELDNRVNALEQEHISI